MAKGMGSTVVKIKSPAKVLESARRKIEGAKDTWAEETVKGFMSDWSDWFSNFIIPRLMRIRLPPKSDNIAENVARRVTPIAMAVSQASNQYRQYKNSKLAQNLAPVPPQTATI